MQVSPDLSKVLFDGSLKQAQGDRMLCSVYDLSGQCKLWEGSDEGLTLYSAAWHANGSVFLFAAQSSTKHPASIWTVDLEENSSHTFAKQCLFWQLPESWGPYRAANFSSSQDCAWVAWTVYDDDDHDSQCIQAHWPSGKNLDLHADDEPIINFTWSWEGDYCAYFLPFCCDGTKLCAGKPLSSDLSQVNCHMAAREVSCPLAISENTSPAEADFDLQQAWSPGGDILAVSLEVRRAHAPGCPPGLPENTTVALVDVLCPSLPIVSFLEFERPFFLENLSWAPDGATLCATGYFYPGPVAKHRHEDWCAYLFCFSEHA